MDATKTKAVLGEVLFERERQDARWGQQDIPVVPRQLVEGLTPEGLCRYFGVKTEADAKRDCADAVAQGSITFADLLVEELSESIAAAAKGDAFVRTELIQVAALAVQAIEAIDRRAVK